MSDIDIALDAKAMIMTYGLEATAEGTFTIDVHM